MHWAIGAFLLVLCGVTTSLAAVGGAGHAHSRSKRFIHWENNALGGDADGADAADEGGDWGAVERGNGDGQIYGEPSGEDGEELVYMPYPLNEFYGPDMSEESGLESEEENGDPLQDLSGGEEAGNPGQEAYGPMRKRQPSPSAEARLRKLMRQRYARRKQLAKAKAALCFHREQHCNPRHNMCCKSFVCRCNLFGTNCKCDRPGLLFGG